MTDGHRRPLWRRALSRAGRTLRQWSADIAWHRAGIARHGVVRWLFEQAKSYEYWNKNVLIGWSWPPSSRYPVYVRPGTSDLNVYDQVFIGHEYRCLDVVRSPKLILDCGANVGYTSAYLLTRFRTATVVAVEPDPGNYRVLRANLARFGARARTIRAGVWSRACGLKVERNGFRDSRDWAVWVRECRSDERPDTPAVDIGELLTKSGYDKISILKMDIERSEFEVFRHGPPAWLDRCDAIAIELHDEECEAVFHAAITDQGFRISRSGELTVCVRDQ